MTTINIPTASLIGRTFDITHEGWKVFYRRTDKNVNREITVEKRAQNFMRQFRKEVKWITDNDKPYPIMDRYVDNGLFKMIRKLPDNHVNY